MTSPPGEAKQGGRRDLIRFLSFVIVFVGAVFVLRSGLTGIEWDPGALRAWFERSGNLAPILFFLLFPILINLWFPFTGLSLVAGMLFGLKTALLLLLPATVICHALGYAISGWFLRETVRKMLERLNLLRFMESFEEMSAWRLCFAFRFTPLSVGMQNYVLGVARIPFLPYMVGSFLGTLPWLVPFVLAGASAGSTLGLSIAGGIIAWGVLILLANRWWRLQKERSGTGTPDPPPAE